jgi:protein-S-isoprenylcysteine O-methyltransferase Ste14
VLYLAGTAIRIRAEETLLRERFGLAFDAWARETPALIPFALGGSSNP